MGKAPEERAEEIEEIATWVLEASEEVVPIMGKEGIRPLNLVMVSIAETVETVIVAMIVEAGMTAIMTKGVGGTPEATGEAET